MKHREAWQAGRDGNYVNGTIRDLPIGNTELAAKMIQECTGAEFFKLEPMAVFTFLEHFDFTGKTIVPFCPHEGSSEKDIRRLCPGAAVKKGLAIHGASVSRSEGEIRSWLRKE